MGGTGGGGNGTVTALRWLQTRRAPVTLAARGNDMGAIEQAILTNDARGISRAARHLPSTYVTDAARFAIGRPGTVLIATGFFVLHTGCGDTDGPLGAVTL